MADSATRQVEPGWLEERRRNGTTLVEELALPTQKDKGWEFTDLQRLDLDAYENGDADVSVSVPDDLPDGVAVLRLADALESHADLLADRLGSVVPSRDPFVARNETAWTDGILIYVPRGVQLEGAVDITISLDDPGIAANWRTLIVLEENAEAEVWERWRSDSDETDALLNAVTELVVGEGATLRYLSLQDLSESAWVFGTQRGEVQKDGTLEWTAVGIGSGKGKVRMETKLAGTGSEAKVTGGYAGGPGQHLDYDTLQEHAAPNTVSDLAFRGVLGDRATSVWRGMIKVDPGAQQTDAFQENRNLLLSPDAHADAIPGLEILADDVRCTHAAAIAQIDRDQLFYLRSRGLEDGVAKRMVIDGFLQELVTRIEQGPQRDTISGALENRLAEILD